MPVSSKSIQILTTKMDYPFLKHLSDEQIQILKTTCEGGTLETMNTIESGFASWGHAKFLSKEVVRLAQIVNAFSEAGQNPKHRI